jgi:hypothetical protein
MWPICYWFGRLGEAGKSPCEWPLGPAGSHIFRQLLTESVLLATVGGLAGVFLGTVGLRVLLVLCVEGSAAHARR